MIWAAIECTASSTYVSSPSLQGENTWAARVQCPITVTPCKWSDHCDQYLCLTKYRKLETCEWRAWPCLWCSSRGDRRCTCGNRTCHMQAALHTHHMYLVFLNTDTCQTFSKNYLRALKSIKHCSTPRENVTSWAGWNHGGVRIPEQTVNRGLTHKHTRMPLSLWFFITCFFVVTMYLFL